MAEVVSLETVLRWKIKVVFKTGATLYSNGPQTLKELMARCGNEPILSLEDAYYSYYRHGGSWIKVRKK